MNSEPNEKKDAPAPAKDPEPRPLPSNVVEVQPGVYTVRGVTSAWVALSRRQTKKTK